MNKKNINSQIKTNKLAKILATATTWLFASLFILLIIFIILESIPGFKAYGFKGIFLTNNFLASDLELKEVSVWLPLFVTIIITIGSLLIAVPLGVKTATFIHFRIKKESLKKFVKIIIEISAAIPSVVFGLFAYKSLGIVVKTVFNLSIPNTILTSIFMLSIMITPTIILLTLNAFSGVEYSLIINSMSLANSKTKAIYKVFRKETKKQIVVAVVIAASRVIGETMAVSMILSSENYSDVFNGGFLDILTSSLRPLGAVISKGMFAENGGPEFRGLLFAFGITMFVIVMIMNSLVIVATNSKLSHRFSWFNKFSNFIGTIFLLIPDQISYVFNRLFYKPKYKIDEKNYSTNTSLYIQERISKSKTLNLYSYYKTSWEIINSSIVFGTILWIVFDILTQGLYAVSQSTTTVFLYTKNTTGQAVLNTLLLIMIIILISLPISFLMAIWLNEYSKNNKTKKCILFFMDSIGATPSIIFGMFGLSLFIEILQISSGGRMGNSLLAGALTMIIVILPTFTRMNQQALQAVPNDIRYNGYALGNSKWYVIRTLVLKQAYKGIFSSTILTIGRILAETAPLFLTAGLSSSTTISLLNPGQTLTTRIYAQLNGTSVSESTNIMYESALIALLLILFIIIIGYVILPNWTSIKKYVITQYEIHQMLWRQNKIDNTIEKYRSQIQDKNLYLTQSQADKLNVENNNIWCYQNDYVKIQIISDNEIHQMERKYKLINKK